MARVFFILIILSVISVCSAAKSLDYPFERLTDEDGLSQSSIWAIYQDRFGYIWFGTEEGLNRFDGLDFKVYYHDPADSTSIPDNEILDMMEDSQGTLWIATGHGVSLVNLPGQKFYKLQPPEEFKFINEAAIICVYEDSKNNIWLGTQRNGLVKYNPASKEIRNFTISESSNEADFYGSQVTGIQEDSEGTLFVATLGGGLYTLNPDKNEFVSVVLSTKNKNRDIAELLLSTSGTFWIGTHEGDLYFRGKGQKVYSAVLSLKVSNGGKKSKIRTVSEDNYGYIWVGTEGSGLFRINPNDLSCASLKNNPSNRQSISSNYIRAVFMDRSNVLWVGTWGNGLSHYSRYRDKFETFRYTPGDPRSLSSNSIWCIHEDNDGFAWVGTYGGGLNRINIESDEVKTINRSNSKLTSDLIVSIDIDSKGNLWLGSYGGGLMRYNPASNRIKNYYHMAIDAKTLPSNIILNTLIDGYDTLWVATPMGVARLDKNSSTFKRFIVTDGVNGLKDNLAWSLAEDLNNNIWIGTHSKGLHLYNRQSGAINHITELYPELESFGKEQITAIVPDKNLIWTGTENGLYKLNLETGQLQKFDRDSGLKNNTINGITLDNAGNVWVSTNRGVTVYNKKSNKFRYFSKIDGLQSNEFNKGAFHSGQSGTLYFGGVKGLNAFTPELVLLINGHHPELAITGVKLDEKTVIHDIVPGIHKEVIVNYRIKRIRIDFTALDYTAPELNLYSYMLDGYDDDWSAASQQRFANYTNLNPGTYTFSVRCANSDKLWNPTPLHVKIIVKPAPWETIWAKLFYLLVLLGLMYVLYRILRRRHYQAVKRAKLQAELDAAIQIQENILPIGIHNLGDFTLEGFSHPATTMRGDFFDFRHFEDGRLFVAVGDASGHGLPAGVMVSVAKGGLGTVFDKKVREVFSLEDALQMFNRAIYDGTAKNTRLFMTFCFALFDPAKKKVTISVNGHPAPLVIGKDKKLKELDVEYAFPLGRQVDHEFYFHEFDYNPGDIMLIFSDGIAEQINNEGDAWGYDSLGDAFTRITNNNHVTKLTDSLYAEVMKHAGSVEQKDDITMVTIHLNSENG